jgi:uncharacterized surface protein with fasciclin (FAS1) repeats
VGGWLGPVWPAVVWPTRCPALCRRGSAARGGHAERGSASGEKLISHKTTVKTKWIPFGFTIRLRRIFWRANRVNQSTLENPMKKTLIASFLALGMSLSAQAKDIVDTAVGAGNFKTLAAALTAAGLVDTLKGKGPFTVFAPTDEAFAKVPKADLDALLKDKAKLTAVLTYHVVPGKVMASDVKAGKVKTVQGSQLTVSTMGGVKVDGANVIKTDIVADNGVIHVIDSVVIPK